MTDLKNFMSIVPRSKNFMGLNTGPIVLKVIRDDGVNIKPSIKFQESDLDNGDKYFKNNSGVCDSFTISVLLDTTIKYTVKKETVVEHAATPSNNIIVQVNQNNPSFSYEPNAWTETITEIKDYRVDEVLDYFIRNAEPFYITSRAIGINDENELWLVTENPSRKQAWENGYVRWELTFTKYRELTALSFRKTNKGVKSALNKLKNKNKKKTSKAKSKSKVQTTLKNNLKTKCKASNLVYSKTKKSVTCVKYMQELLQYYGCMENKKSLVDGWFNKVTLEAVKKFQKKYAKTYKLKETGKVDSATFKALYSVTSSTPAKKKSNTVNINGKKLTLQTTTKNKNKNKNKKKGKK